MFTRPDDTGAAARGSSGVSPDVLRGLHADLVRQLRRRALLWSVICGAVGALLLVPGLSTFSSLLLVTVLTAAQAGKAWLDWRATRRIDPEADADWLTAHAERERDRRVAFTTRLMSRSPTVTIALAALVVAVTAAEWLLTGSLGRAVARAGLVKFLVNDGEWWRLISATFLHANLQHLAGNMIGLVIFGRIVEAFVPRPWLLATYLASGLAGSLASWWLSPETHSVGASGGVMGVIAFAAMLAWRRPDEFPEEVRHRGWIAVALTMWIGLLGDLRVDNAAHAGGIVAGAVLGLMAVAPGGRERESAPGLAGMAVVSVLALIGGAVQTVAALAGPARTPAATEAIAAAQPVSLSVRSVRARVERERGGPFVVIENHGARTLEAYDIRLFGDSLQVWRDDCCVESPDGRPIAPGGIGRIRIRTTPRLRVNTAASVKAALFDDGSYEGDRALWQAMVGRRREALDETVFWLDLLGRAPAGPPERTAEYLKRYASIRAAQSEYAPASLQALGVPLLIATGLQKQAEFAAELERTRARITSARDALTIRLTATARR